MKKNETTELPPVIVDQALHRFDDDFELELGASKHLILTLKQVVVLNGKCTQGPKFCSVFSTSRLAYIYIHELGMFSECEIMGHFNSVTF